jgi:hypothetical protein
MENLPKPGVRQLQDRHSPQISGFGVRTVYHNIGRSSAAQHSTKWAPSRLAALQRKSSFNGRLNICFY